MARSAVHDLENARNPDPERAGAVQQLLDRWNEAPAVTDAVRARADELSVAGFRGLDAAHLAWAERWGAHVFISTDDKLLSLAQRISGQLRIQVCDPLSYLRELR